MLMFMYLVFPIPLVFLVLISLPFPAAYRSKIRKGVVDAVNRLAFLKFEAGGASVSLIAIIIIMALLGLGFSLNDSLTARRQESEALFFAEKKELRCKRWRAERNVWLSVLACTLWVVLIRVQTLLQDVGPMEDQLKLAEEERNKAVAEAKQQKAVMTRLQDAVDAASREAKEKDGVILALKAKGEELEKAKAKVAKLEMENESLKRETKKDT